METTSIPTAREMLLGAPIRGMISIDGLRVEVHVRDMRTVWGRIHYLVEPVAGSGQKWVDASRVTPVETATQVS